jgi:hypothetical protein
LPGYYFNSTSTSAHKIIACKRNKIVRSNHVTTSLNNVHADLHTASKPNENELIKKAVDASHKTSNYKQTATTTQKNYNPAISKQKTFKYVAEPLSTPSSVQENSNSTSQGSTFWETVAIVLGILGFILFQSFFILVISIKSETFSEYWWTILIGLLFYGGASYCIYAGIVMGSFLLGLGILLYVLALLINFFVLYICSGTEC